MSYQKKSTSNFWKINKFWGLHLWHFYCWRKREREREKKKWENCPYISCSISFFLQNKQNLLFHLPTAICCRFFIGAWCFELIKISVSPIIQHCPDLSIYCICSMVLFNNYSEFCSNKLLVCAARRGGSWFCLLCLWCKKLG